MARLLRDDVNDVGVSRIEGECVTEVARETLRDLDPVVTPVIAPIGPAVVLLVETVGARGVEQELVHTLACLRVLLRGEVGAKDAVEGATPRVIVCWSVVR